MRPVDDIVTFPFVKASRVLQPHEDALVLTLGISGFDVRRVLIDPGSSTDLLQMSAYKQMDYLLSALENLGRLLSRFNGATMTSQADPLQPLSLSHDTGKITYTSSLLTSDELELLESVFQWNKDVFAWTHSDMPGIHPSMASHRLNVIPSSHPIRQKAHQVIVLTNQPLRVTLHKLNLSGRMLKWAIELTHLVESPGEQWWTLHVDETSKASDSKVSLILQSPTGKLLEQAIRLYFSTSNNEAEYEAVLARLDFAITLTTTRLEIRSDYQLIVGQIQKEYEEKDECMARYLAMVENCLKNLDEWIVRQVP
ncbi:hypothetical protein CK203_098275 [Vitis vinifera]|uniref:RNase H type-1 domain-containing protein n=1 Tax=Vitis vinifera TaxID=29760 RepID=A0A438E4J0_VITVI|nr:hypothetical protein CK203_098275 [Vitis vinifera]